MIPKLGYTLRKANQLFLPILSTGLLVFIILEIIAPNSVTSVLNLSSWFVAWLISAIIELLVRSRE